MSVKCPALLASCLLTLACTLESAAQEPDIRYMSSGGRLHPLQAAMDIRHYDIRLKVDVASRSISGWTQVDVSLNAPADSLLLDLVHLLKVDAVEVDGKRVGFEHRKDRIFIGGNAPFSAGRHGIRVHYGGKPPVAVRPPWLGGFTWAKDSLGLDWISINCQKEGGRLYFPCKDHPSDEPNEGVDMHITVPKHLVVAGPGLLVGTNARNAWKTYHWRTRYTISNYCIVFNIGDYKVHSDSYTTINGNRVPIDYYVLTVDTSHAAKVIATRKRDAAILEKYFGEYPWHREKMGIAEVPNSGMEHQTMITFDNKFKYVSVGGHEYSANLFHEFAHEWWANKVTNRDWAHLWIQEGIATYAEALIHYELAGQKAYDDIIAGHRRGIRHRKAMVLGDEVSEDETYAGSDIYTKGSFFMHGLRYIMGDGPFFKALYRLANDSAYTYDSFVTSMDVERLFNTVYGKDLSGFFHHYLRTTDPVDFRVRESGKNRYEIRIANHFMDLPVDIMTDQGVARMTVTREGITVESAHKPMVDPKGVYLGRITYN